MDNYIPPRDTCTHAPRSPICLPASGHHSLDVFVSRTVSQFNGGASSDLYVCERGVAYLRSASTNKDIKRHYPSRLSAKLRYWSSIASLLWNPFLPLTLSSVLFRVQSTWKIAFCFIRSKFRCLREFSSGYRSFVIFSSQPISSSSVSIEKTLTYRFPDFSQCHS